MNKYLCACCGKLSPLDAVAWLDSGTTLTCVYCRGETVVDLFTTEQRTALYRDARRLSLR